MRQMRQRFRNRQQQQQRDFSSFHGQDSHTPNDAAAIRHLRQRFYAKRDSELTPSETGFMCQTRQEACIQTPEIITEIASLLFVLKYLSTVLLETFSRS